MWLRKKTQNLPIGPGRGTLEGTRGDQGGDAARYDKDLREPLVQCQVSQVSMHVKRGRVSWLTNHGRGIVIFLSREGRDLGALPRKAVVV